MSEVPSGLLLRVIVRFGVGALILAAVLFGTAGTLDYWQAWVYLAVLFIPMTFVLVYLLRRDPQLLERRMRGREPLAAQRGIVVAATLVILLAFVIPGLDRRFGWTYLPPALVVAFDVIVLVGYAFFILVLRENSYASHTVQVEAGQRAVTTGPYRVVRHPDGSGADRDVPRLAAGARVGLGLAARAAGADRAHGADSQRGTTAGARPARLSGGSIRDGVSSGPRDLVNRPR